MIPEKYRNIIHLPHHVSPTRTPMSKVARAAQFSPFAALVGYDAMIDETNRTTEEKFDFGEEDRAELDRKLALIVENQSQKPIVEITYFIADKKKEGGSYRTVTKQIKRVDFVRRKLLFTDRTELSIDDVSDFGGEFFENPS